MDPGLVRRIEAVEAWGTRACAEAMTRIRPGDEAAHRPFAGGCAAFVGTDSPLTQVMGAGLDGPVTVKDLSSLERFYRDRGAPAKLDLSPLADASLWELLEKRGYRPEERKSVLVRTLSPGDVFPEIGDGIAVHTVEDGEMETFAHTVALAFNEGEEPPPEFLDVFRVFDAGGATCLLARWEGEPAGGGSMAIHDGTVTLFGTATLRPLRGHGIHAALLYERLRRAAAQGCDLAMVSTRPGTQSQRNLERLDFHVVYTRVTMRKDWSK